MWEAIFKIIVPLVEIILDQINADKKVKQSFYTFIDKANQNTSINIKLSAKKQREYLNKS